MMSSLALCRQKRSLECARHRGRCSQVRSSVDVALRCLVTVRALCGTPPSPPSPSSPLAQASSFSVSRKFSPPMVSFAPKTFLPAPAFCGKQSSQCFPPPERNIAVSRVQVLRCSGNFRQGPPPYCHSPSIPSVRLSRSPPPSLSSVEPAFRPLVYTPSRHLLGAFMGTKNTIPVDCCPA